MKKILTTLLILISLTAASQRQKPVPARVMTFNIRLENKGDGQNNWELRFQKVADFIERSKADVLGLQEVKKVQLEDLERLLSDYLIIGVGRDDGKQKGEYCPILYNKKKFKLINSGTFWLSETPTKPSRGWDAACNRICTWAILQDLKTLKSLIVANTHLDHVGEVAREEGLTLLKERLSRMNNGLPLVLTGDFNVSDKNPLYQRALTRIFPLRDAWKAAERTKGSAATFHDFGRINKAERQKIDYIFVNALITVKRAEIYDTELGGGFFLSDHNAHTADIVF